MSTWKYEERHSKNSLNSNLGESDFEEKSNFNFEWYLRIPFIARIWQNIWNDILMNKSSLF